MVSLRRRAVSREVIYPYPDPSVVGLKLDPKEMATIERVDRVRPRSVPGSSRAMRSSRLRSTAAVDRRRAVGACTTRPQRETSAASEARGDEHPARLSLDAGWRRGNISWRTTTWPLREMGFGGMKLENLKDEERRQAGLAADHMALKIVYFFEYGDRIAAKRAGLRKGDIIVSVDGKDRPMTESELLGTSLEQKRPGDRVSVTFLRDGTKKTVTYAA